MSENYAKKSAALVLGAHLHLSEQGSEEIVNMIIEAVKYELRTENKRKFRGREMILECVDCGHRQQGWSNRDGIPCEKCGGYTDPKGWGKV